MKRVLTKRLLIILAITLAATIGYLTIKPDTAVCDWCPTYTCYGAGTCGMGCACMTPPGTVGGMCVSFNRGVN